MQIVYFDLSTSITEIIHLYLQTEQESKIQSIHIQELFDTS